MLWVMMSLLKFIYSFSYYLLVCIKAKVSVSDYVDVPIKTKK